MKRFLALLTALFISHSIFAQYTDTITVGGDVNKYYPVKFYDGGWDNNVATVLQIGRSNVHLAGGGYSWLGSVIATFKYHVTAWGHGSNFIDADIHQLYSPYGANYPLVGGWADVTGGNGNHEILIWLRGNTPYYLHSNYPVLPVVYVTSDYIEQPGNIVHTFKPAPEPYVNYQGVTFQESGYFNGTGLNYFGGSVGIGTRTTGSFKLAVEGAIGARKIQVTQGAWADFVFQPDYKLPSLQETEQYVKANSHLPGIPSEKEVQEKGIDIGEMNKILVQKIEELTLHVIAQQKQLDSIKVVMQPAGH